MEDKLYYDYLDIMKMFNCGRDRAYAIIRSIKSVSDSLNIKGRVTRNDYLAWYNRPIKKDNASNFQDEYIVFQNEIH